MNRPSPLKKKRVAPLLPPPLRVQKPPPAAAVSAGMSTWNSVVTAHKPTSVSRSFVGDFTSSTSPSYCQTFQEMRPLSRRRPFIQGGDEAREDLMVGNTTLLTSDYTNPAIFSLSLLSENAYISAVILQIKQFIMICTVHVYTLSRHDLQRHLVELVTVWQDREASVPAVQVSHGPQFIEVRTSMMLSD
ncbi:uncharacterized protein [Triticum aestivum]|uniref:uncharacterized protein isoform X1 n=1 Tax=Triticum aestivum TaxID=4565 RepID=UPI001D0275B8|nr:uncharacterized protein LOC123168241 isoform X1 [Triticum aestivum]